MGNTFTTVKVPGRVMLALLENGVSNWPKYDGRWPIFAGCKFQFDPEKEAGNRIVPDSFVDENDVPVDLEKLYSLAIDSFLSKGKDGFSAILDPAVIKSDSEIVELGVVDMIKNWLNNFKKSNEEIQKMSDNKKAFLNKQLEVMNTSIENRDSDTGWIKIQPRTSGRVICINGSIEH